MYFLFKMGIFHCYVCLPEGILNIDLSRKMQVTCWIAAGNLQYPGAQIPRPIFRCQVTQYRVWEDPRRSQTPGRNNVFTAGVLLVPKKISSYRLPNNKKKQLSIYLKLEMRFFFRKKKKKQHHCSTVSICPSLGGGVLQTPNPSVLCQSFWTPFGAMAGLKQAEKWRVRGGATESFQSFQWWGVAEAEKFPSWDGMGCFFLPYHPYL